MAKGRRKLLTEAGPGLSVKAGPGGTKPCFSAERRAPWPTDSRHLTDSDAITMTSMRTKSLRRYAAGMLAVFGGAWLTAETGSMLPLALGAAAALMSTASLVRAIWSGRRDAR